VVVYNVVLEETHIGVCVYPFADLDAANAYAKELAESYVHPEGEIESYSTGELAAWKFSEEGGYAWVSAEEVRC
jgi:hypothetical protein